MKHEDMQPRASSHLFGGRQPRLVGTAPMSHLIYLEGGSRVWLALPQ
jgi:hypothetical protein